MKILKNLFLYVLVPLLLLWLLAEPIGSAVRLSDTNAFLILSAAVIAAGLNWYIYAMIHRKRPSLLVFTHGVCCLMIVSAIQLEALPADCALSATMAVISGSLLLATMLLFSFWLASCRNRPAHAAAVTIWVILGFILCGMAYRIIRDIEIRQVSQDTWITAGFLMLLLLGCSARKILSSYRRAASRRRASGLAAGRIVQIIGETYLDRDGDPVTPYLARIQYSVKDVLYETRAEISKIATRKYGREAFMGREVPVFYNPEDPADAFANRIDKHIFDQQDKGAVSAWSE